MRQKRLAAISLKFFLPLMLLCGTAFGAVTSYDNTFVANDIYASDFPSRLNRNFSQSLTGGINNIESANIKDDTISEADMADDINPRIRTSEGAACQFVYSGLLPATGASLTQDTSAGTAYPMGFRVIKSSATSHTYTASKWTWVDLDQNGDFQYSAVAIGGATPAVAANSIRLARVSSDTATINTVTDLRTTSCTSGPLSILSDATGEASLGNIFLYPKWGNGLNLVSNDATTVYVQPGASNINGKYRTLTSQLSVPINSVGSSVTGISGLDTGSVAASTTYYLYGTADIDGVKPVTGILSASASAPSGGTNYRRLGELTTDASSSLISADVVSVNYLGKVRQIKKFVTTETLTGSTVVPYDDTLPLNSEGDQILTATFTPVSASDVLEIEVFAQIGNSASNENVAMSLYKNSNTGSLRTSWQQGNVSAGVSKIYTLKRYLTAGSVASITFNVRAGAASGSIYLNSDAGTRKYGGALASFIKITEYEA